MHGAGQLSLEVNEEESGNGELSRAQFKDTVLLAFDQVSQGSSAKDAHNLTSVMFATYAASPPPPPPPRWGTSSASASSTNPTEDWAKISDLAERRRIQNRIALRNYRTKLKRRLEDLERRVAASHEESLKSKTTQIDDTVSEPLLEAIDRASSEVIRLANVAASSRIRLTSSLTAHSHKSLQQPLRENRRKVLRVAIHGQEDAACPDSGSQKNIMVESYAKQNRLRIRRGREDQRIFELGNGKKIRSVGRVRARVRLLAGDPYPQKEWFYVFANCPVPLILGMPFLERNEILTKNRSLLEDCPLAYSQIDSVFWIGSVRNRLQCSLDSHKAIAVADTGSDVNLMSLEYAKREGYQIDRRREFRRRLQFGDGSQADTVGQVYVHNLTLDWRGSETRPVPMAPPLADMDANAPSFGQGTNEESGSAQLSAVFFILPGLPCDIIFGRDLLETTDAFNLCPDLKSREETRRDILGELNIIIDRGRIAWFLRSLLKKPDSAAAAVQSDIERHDSERHAYWYRMSQLEEEIERSTGLIMEQRRAVKEKMLREWETNHVNCQFCVQV
ncbi:hypothetical protein SCAR479_02658 [Seiridium cardinale]|uniref:BZIP domain-containing protein n=1 Tax=Seiridium cardinale TaxID=138064 RepID=A0ABR2Y376_9PEZI